MTVSNRKSYVHGRRMLHEVTLDVVATAMGREPADLIIRNGRLVNVNVGRIQDGMDIAVRHGIIAFVGKGDHLVVGKNTKVVDANGRFLVPGFIDTHDHVESSMVDVRSFAAGILPHGTTTIACDNHEITNVFGERAVELFHKVAEGLPLKVLVAMPVCVPSIPGFEDAGAVITAKEVAHSYAEGWAQVQGEQMNFPGVIYGDPQVHAITAASLKAGVILTGHYASLELDKGLPAFVAAGMNACHEGTTAEAVLRRAELGCYPQQRYGTAWLDMPNTIKAITENPGIDTRFFTMVTDDVTPATVVEQGHLDRVVRDAIKQGVSPILAIQMVTLNAAQLLEKSRWIGTISPGRAADILIVSDLVNLAIDQVFADGALVAENGKMVVEFSKYEYPEWALKSVHLDTLSVKDFRVPAEAPVKVRVMRIYPGMVHTTEEVSELKPKDNSLSADPSRDIAKVAIFYRHALKAGVTGSKAFGFVTGMQFKPNCAYASTVSHDCHNLLVIGTSDEAMAQAANELIKVGGGLALVVNNKVDALMPMPLAGLMSLAPVDEAARLICTIEDAFKHAGSPFDSIEMTISLLGLIVLEELHLSNKGYVELKSGQPPKFVDLISA
ncbi:MAG: adenine deaminase C-terminal domain-containing protein [Anaerolineaceae bacterium]|nr:adenine deaminase C-terminal domain-containing protein [Anaerolineaceae bacterium]